MKYFLFQSKIYNDRLMIVAGCGDDEDECGGVPGGGDGGGAGDGDHSGGDHGEEVEAQTEVSNYPDNY